MNVKIKICGLTNLRDAKAAAAAGADFLGFVLTPESPRCVTPEKVRAIVAGMPAGAPLKVGVVVNRRPAEVIRLLEECKLDLIQLHGEESAATAEKIGTGRVWKMMPLRTPQDVLAAVAFPAAAIVADTVVPGRHGGSGVVGDWSLARTLAARQRVVLAGGLTPENVGVAVRVVRPFGVDVGSGVELSPGKKDHARMKAFVQAVREAEVAGTR